MKRLISFIIIFFALNPAVYCETSAEKSFEEKRNKMVEQQIIRRGVKNKSVIRAMLKVPRHDFVPRNLEDVAYEDTPLPIGYVLSTEEVRSSNGKEIFHNQRAIFRISNRKCGTMFGQRRIFSPVFIYFLFLG